MDGGAGKKLGLKERYSVMTRGLGWDTTYQPMDKVFPYDKFEGITIHDWDKWEDPFRMTMDALLASQKDPARFPAWLMNHPVKQTELRIYFAVVKAPPLNVTSIYDWLVPVEDAFPGAEVWMYDALAYFLMQKGMAKNDFFRKA